MLEVSYSARFKKDFRRCVKRGCDMSKLHGIIDTLRIPETLPEKNQDHILSGNYVGRRECHIGPDWLLVYEIDKGELYLERTGTHADLFKK